MTTSKTKKTTTVVPAIIVNPISSLIKTDANIDMSSIVAYFISKYENGLFEQKTKLSAEINKLKSWLNEGFQAELEVDVKLDSYKTHLENFNVSLKASVKFDANLLQATVYVFSKSEGDWCGNLNLWKPVKVSDELIKKYNDTYNKMETLRRELQVVLESLSNVSRKEREIRGKIAEKTLRESGNGELFDSEDLLNLVKMPTLSVK